MSCGVLCCCGFNGLPCVLQIHFVLFAIRCAFCVLHSFPQLKSQKVSAKAEPITKPASRITRVVEPCWQHDICYGLHSVPLLVKGQRSQLTANSKYNWNLTGICASSNNQHQLFTTYAVLTKSLCHALKTRTRRCKPLTTLLCTLGR